MGFIVLLWKKLGNFQAIYIIILLLITLLPAAVTVPNPHALRGSGMFILAPIITTIGILFIAKNLTKKYFQPTFISIILLAIFINGLWNFTTFYKVQNFKESYFDEPRTKVSKKLAHIHSNYDSIHWLTDCTTSPLYIAHFVNIPPKDFYDYPKDIDKSGKWDNFKRLGKFHFYPLNTPLKDLPITENNSKSLWITPSKIPELYPVDSLKIFQNEWVYFSEKFLK